MFAPNRRFERESKILNKLSKSGIDIELINLAEGDRQVMALAQGIWWFAKKNSPLATYIGMKEIETMMIQDMIDDEKKHN